MIIGGNLILGMTRTILGKYITKNKSSSIEVQGKKTKKKQSQRLIFQQSRSERNSGERKNYESIKLQKVRKKSGGATKQYKEIEMKFTPSKLFSLKKNRLSSACSIE